jgi:DNA-binding CsgD family transcriptional regulator
VANEDRVEGLLVQILLQSMKGTTVRDRVVALSAAGLPNLEIADYLGINTGGVATYLYEARKKTGKKPAKKTTGKKGA